MLRFLEFAFWRRYHIFQIFRTIALEGVPGLAGGEGAGLKERLKEALGGHSKETKAAMKILGVSPAKTFMDGLKMGLGGGASKSQSYVTYLFSSNKRSL